MRLNFRFSILIAILFVFTGMLLSRFAGGTDLSYAIASSGPTTTQYVSTTQESKPRTPIVAPAAGKTLELTIKELGNFEYDIDKGGNIPADVIALNGVHFKTFGFMIPLDQTEAISEFALVPSLSICCIQGAPQIQHSIIVRCAKGKAVSYYGEELVVEGTLKVEEKKDGGYIISIFELTPTSIKPSPK